MKVVCEFPFFVYWKDTIKAGENDHICTLYDVLATAADLAGIMPPKTDGISFAPTLLARPNEQELTNTCTGKTECVHSTHKASDKPMVGLQGASLQAGNVV